MDPSDPKWIARALGLAERGASEGEVPVGAVLVHHNGTADVSVGEAWNRPIAIQDPTAHAEILALRAAAIQLGNYRLLNSTLYVTLEPCAMCVGAMIQARIGRLVFGAFDPKAGAVQSVFQLLDSASLNHKISYNGGVMAEECAAILRQFFQVRRHFKRARVEDRV